MNRSGSQTISAPRTVVWKGLNDPHVLQQCIPGCDKIIASSPTDLKATVVIKVGPVKAAFSGVVKLSDMKPPESYRISGKGEGGFAGFATGGATVKLTELGPNETQMDYEVDAEIGGKLAMLGSRLIDGTARSLADQFFTKFASLMKTAGKSAPAAKKPTAKKPAIKKAAAKKPAAKKATVKKPAAKKPAAKKLVAKKPAAKKPAAKKPAAKKPTAKKPAAKKPAAKKAKS
jgi:uncharacterized protein